MTDNIRAQWLLSELPLEVLRLTGQLAAIVQVASDLSGRALEADEENHALMICKEEEYTDSDRVYLDFHDELYTLRERLNDAANMAANLNNQLMLK